MRLYISLIIVILWAFFALFGSFLPLQPNAIDLHEILTPPNSEAWFGHDDLGRSMWDRLVMGANTSFVVAFWVILISATTGTLIGAFSAYAGGWLDHLIVRIIDIFLAFPGILLAIAMAGLMGPGIDNVIIALCTVGWVGYARLSRAQVLSIKQREHVQAARALGIHPFFIVIRHLLPLILAPLIVEATFGVAAVIIGEAGLSFLGLGVQPPDASWGSMIRDGARYMLIAPHMVIIPGIALMIVVLAVNLLGDCLRDRLDIKQRAYNENNK